VTIPTSKTTIVRDERCDAQLDDATRPDRAHDAHDVHAIRGCDSTMQSHRGDEDEREDVRDDDRRIDSPVIVIMSSRSIRARALTKQKTHRKKIFFSDVARASTTSRAMQKKSTVPKSSICGHAYFTRK
jgi:hypothetical protein